MLYATQNYDLEEQKCSVKLQRQHDIQHLGQTELFHWAACDSCVVLIWMVATAKTFDLGITPIYM